MSVSRPGEHCRFPSLESRPPEAFPPSPKGAPLSRLRRQLAPRESGTPPPQCAHWSTSLDKGGRVSLSIYWRSV